MTRAAGARKLYVSAGALAPHHWIQALGVQRSQVYVAVVALTKDAAVLMMRERGYYHARATDLRMVGAGVPASFLPVARLLDARVIDLATENVFIWADYRPDTPVALVGRGVITIVGWFRGTGAALRFERATLPTERE